VKWRFKAIRTRYWKPGTEYLEAITLSLGSRLKDGDVVVVSEKAISTAKGNLVDEDKAVPGWTAKFIARFWMRWVWGYILGPLCHLKPRTVRHLRGYPLRDGARHKQVVLGAAGLLSALKYGSEGGIDVSNLPLRYACLPLEKPSLEADRIRGSIRDALGRQVIILITNTDSTFSIGSFHFTSRPSPIPGVKSCGGFVTYFLGKALRLRERATPLAVSGSNLGVEDALDLSELAHRARGSGAGRTVWDAAERFGVEASEVTWRMLESADHFPLVLFRLRKDR